jgi:uncharacterized protein YjbI with pentapeptide repeats
MADKTEHTEPTGATDAYAGPVPGSSEPPLLPPTAKALAGKAKDLQALWDTVVDAASVGAGLWFSYVFVLLYLLISVGGITHRDLFLESPVKLPFLNVDLPLLGFFALGPLIFLIVHAYVLLHFVLLAGKVGDFDAELKAQIKDEEVRTRLRRQLPSNVFVQFLAGPREVRKGVTGFMLRLVAQVSLVIGPILLLVFFELQFLPYHHWWITWWHRIAVLADIVLLWMLWPSIARGKRAGISWRDLQRVKILTLAVLSLFPVLLVTTIATIPDEWLEENLPSLQIVPWWKDETDPQEPREWRLASLHELLVAGEVDMAARRPKSLWSNVLVVPGIDVIDHVKFDSEEKIEALPETISLRARHLEGEVLIGAVLRKANLTAAHLQFARLTGSDLRGAKADCIGDVAQGCAQLQNAELSGVKLQGASLDGARLQGAMFVFAELQGASLGGARLQSASLFYTQLQGANLNGAQLQTAWLDQTGLQGALLNEAQLQGAFLKSVRLEDAALDNAQFQGASLINVFVWRADARKAVWENTRVVNPKTAPEYRSAKSFNKFKIWIAERVPVRIAGLLPGGIDRRTVIERIEQRLDPTKALAGC